MYITAIVPLCRHLTNKARLLFVDSLNLRAYCRSLSCSGESYVVDMRSDVLTKPTPRMLQAMTQASLDDDVFREDRTTLGEWRHKQVGATQRLFCIVGTILLHWSSMVLELLAPLIRRGSKGGAPLPFIFGRQKIFKKIVSALYVILHITVYVRCLIPVV